MDVACGKRQIRDVSQVTNWTVFGIGVFAGGVNTLFFHIIRNSGWSQMNLEMILGSMFTRNVSSSSWWTGFVLHLLVSGLIAYAYAFIFKSARRSGAGVGMNLSLFHWAISGVAFGILPALHPLIIEQYAAPGLFAIGMGFASSLVFLVAHVIYGAVVGALFDQAAIRDEHPKPMTARY